MKRPSKISAWDFPNYVTIPDGYDRKYVPEPTKENMEFLMNEFNDLSEVVAALIDVLEPTGLVFDED